LLHTLRLRILNERVALLVIFAMQTPMDQGFNTPADEFVAWVPEQPFRLSVCQHYGTGAVGHHHAAGAGFDGQPELLLGKVLLRPVTSRIGDADDGSHGRSNRADVLCATILLLQQGMIS
jgi:hypothetical protein